MLALAAPRAASAQSNVLDLRPFEYDRDGRLVYQFYSYTGLLAGGRFMIEAFHLRLPVAHYTETGGGIGFGPSAGVVRPVTGAVLLQMARATDATYFEPAIALTASRSRITSSLFVLRYVPVNSKGTTQWLIDPLDVQLSVGYGVSVGASSYLWRPEGGPSLTKVGGVIGLAIPGGSVQLALRQANQGFGLETQFRTLLSF
jgi:hypothetical protein